jgi:hypothetical protein
VELSSIIHVGGALHQLHWSKGVAACPPPCGVMLIGASLSLLLLVCRILHHSFSLIEIFLNSSVNAMKFIFYEKKRKDIILHKC